MLSITFPYSLNQKNDRKTTEKCTNCNVCIYEKPKRKLSRLYQVKEKKNCNPLFFLQGFLTHKLLEWLENERTPSQNLP